MLAYALIFPFSLSLSLSLSFFLSFFFFVKKMPFRCRCGRTFEKTDTFTSHTSSCVPFHHRRMSDTLQSSFTKLRSPTQEVPPTINDTRDLTSFFMPTALSIQNAFEGARRRSMSYNSVSSSNDPSSQ